MRAALLFLLALGLSSLAPSAHAQLCFTDQKVTKVHVGQVEGHLGSDGGDAVYFTLANGRIYALNKEYNLDWKRGRSLTRQLMWAMLEQYRITGYDHYGNNCDDIDQIRIGK